MDRNTEIVILCVCMNEEHEVYVFNTVTKLLKETYRKVVVALMYRSIESVENLKKEIILFADVITTDAILVFGAHSLKNTIIEEINKISDVKNKIAKILTKFPELLSENPISESLYYSCRKNTLIFCVTGDETQILDIVDRNADAIILAAYLLQNIIPQCDVSNYSFKMEEQIMSCNKNDQSSPLKKEKKMSILSSTSDENIQIDEANIYKPTNETIYLPIVSVDVALTMIHDALIKYKIYNNLEKTDVDIKNSFGKRISKEVVCRTNVPPFSVATKHGYAVTAEQVTKEMGETSIKSNEISSVILNPNTTKWVNSGESIPLEATAVIPADNVVTSYDDKGNEIKTTSHAIKYGENIKFLGNDIKRGEKIVHHITSIGSIEMGLLAACGWKKINVFKEIAIGVLTIGDKLQEPGEPLKPQHSYDSNRAILISLLKENGFNSSDFGIIAKNPTLIVRNITAALKTVNLLVTTGCSNDKDCLKTILKNHFNATLHFGNVNMKPGKSTIFATCTFNNKTKYILCLPGNPVSVFITAHIFLLRLLNIMHLNCELEPTIVMAKIKQKLLLHSRPRYILATLSWSDRESFAEVVCNESNSIDMTNNLSNIINANALLTLPAKTPEVDTLEVPSLIPAMLIKFPFTYFTYA